MNQGRFAVIAVVAALVVAFLWFDLGRYLDLEYLKARQADVDTFYRDHPLTVLAAYFATYVAITGLSFAGRRHHDPGRRCRVRTAVGHRRRLVSHRRWVPPSLSSCPDTSCETESSGDTQTA